MASVSATDMRGCSPKRWNIALEAGMGLFPYQTHAATRPSPDWEDEYIYNPTRWTLAPLKLEFHSLISFSYEDMQPRYCRWSAVGSSEACSAAR